MAGITNSAYRRHLKKQGVGLVVTEMVSAYGLIYQNRRTASYLDFSEEERPVAVQLFGDDPEVMRRATELVLSRPAPPDLIDINMGCPVRKVVRSGAGAALLADPERAVAGWIRTLYHRLPLLDPRTRDAGYGRSGPAPCSLPTRPS